MTYHFRWHKQPRHYSEGALPANPLLCVLLHNSQRCTYISKPTFRSCTKVLLRQILSLLTEFRLPTRARRLFFTADHTVLSKITLVYATMPDKCNGKVKKGNTHRNASAGRMPQILIFGPEIAVTTIHSAEGRQPHRRWRRWLPDFQIKIPVLANQFKISAVRSDEFRSVTPRSQSDQYIEVKIAQFARLVAPFCLDFG